MEWQIAMLCILGGLLVLMVSGMPVAFAFMLVNVLALFFLMGGQAGLRHLSLSIFDSLASFIFLPIPLFILMGEVMFQSGVAPRMIDALDKLLGRLPGRLSLLAVAGGTLIATLTGISMASVAILGSVLLPEMEKRGYAKSMSMGPILGSAGLAIMIPPSSLAVLVGAIGGISISRILMGIIMPGLLMAALFAGYIILRCLLQPSVAPSYEVQPIPVWDRVIAIMRYVLPVGFVIFLVVGVIFLGVATATEAAATGALGTFLLALFYKRLNWEVVKKSVTNSLEMTVMIFMILAGAAAFSQIIAFTGAGQGLVTLMVALPIVPILIFIGMQLITLFLGCFISLVAIAMITLPLFMPVVNTLGFDPVWFAVLYIISLQLGSTTPPFGLDLFVMKGVASPDTTMGEIIQASVPFIYLNLVAIALVIAFPAIALWLPGLMR